MERLEIRHIASTLGQSEFTIRTLASRFVWFLSATRVGEDLFFRQEAMEIFRLIVDQLDAGIRAEHIELMLSKRYPVAEISVMSVSGQMAGDTLSDSALLSGRMPHSTREIGGIEPRDPSHRAAPSEPQQPDHAMGKWPDPASRKAESTQPDAATDPPAQHQEPKNTSNQQASLDALDELQRRIEELEQRLTAEGATQSQDVTVTCPDEPVENGTHISVPSEQNGAAPADRSFDTLTSRPSPWLRRNPK